MKNRLSRTPDNSPQRATHRRNRRWSMDALEKSTAWLSADPADKSGWSSRPTGHCCM